MAGSGPASASATGAIRPEIDAGREDTAIIGTDLAPTTVETNVAPPTGTTQLGKISNSAPLLEFRSAIL